MAIGGVVTRLRGARPPGWNPIWDLATPETQRRSRMEARRRAGAGSATRALAGGLLVTVATVGLFAAAMRASAPGESFVVATRALVPGTILAPDDLTLASMTLPVGSAARAFRDPAELVGTALASGLGPAELVQASTLMTRDRVRNGPELSLRVSTDAMAANLRLGEAIDVVATYGSGSEAVTAVVVGGVPVVAIAAGSGLVSDESALVTVGLRNDADTLALAHAVALGKVLIARSARRPDGPARAVPEPYRPFTANAVGVGSGATVRSTPR